MAAPRVFVATGFLVFRRIQDKIQYLLLQASNGEHHWTPPKGHVDPGETELEAAYRETEEEAGISENQLRMESGFEKSLQYTAFGKPKKVIYWLSELINPEDPVKISHEHQAFRWAQLREACEMVQYPDTIKLLEEADSFLLQKYRSS